MSVQVGRWPCLHAGDSSPEGCCRFCPLASCSLSLQGAKPQPVRLKTKRWWLESGSSEDHPLSPQPRLPAVTHSVNGRREGGEAPKQDVQEYRNRLGKDTCTHRDCTRSRMR